MESVQTNPFLVSNALFSILFALFFKLDILLKKLLISSNQNNTILEQFLATVHILKEAG